LRNTLPLLRYRKYYKKLKHGYCRGTEPVNYAKRIMLFYKLLKLRETDYETAQAKL
jgi:membrane-bound lytic murein transglycosylase F